MRRPNRSWVVALTAVLAVAFTVHSKVSAGQADDGGRGYSEHDWLFAGGNWSSSRYSTLADISTETIDRLGGAWVKRLDGGASSRATPVVKDGVIYLSAGANVFALDGETGDTIWRWQQSGSDASSGARCWSNCERVPSWQGVGLGAGLVFVPLASAEVAALSQETGELVWVGSVGSVPQGAGESVTSAPMYAGGQVFVGLASGDAGGQGRVVALDATTGEVQWSFAVIPPPGAFGHDTWPQDSDIWKIAGGGVWLVGTADPDLGMVYFPTGNPVPMYGGEAREGDNLFTASVLALDMKTGERRWHYQVVKHDVWDADIATPLLLYETEVDGQPRKALAAMRADGQLFLLDRETGEPLVEIEDRPVPQDEFLRTASTQPFPVGLEPIVPDCGFWRDKVPPPFELSCSAFTPPSLDVHTIVAPGVPIPQTRVTPMSFSPQTGYVYAQGRGTVGRVRRFKDPWVTDNRGSGYLRPGLPESVGVLAAVDTRTNTIAWKKEFRGARLAQSGPLTTAGGLMFWAGADGQLEAWDARSGEQLWAFQTSPANVRLRPSPVSTYTVDGRQYIAMAAGNQLWTFTLDGTVPARGGGEPAALEDIPRWIGPPPRETAQIELATVIQNASWAVGGNRSALDEHAFNPVRARVAAGTRVQFLNNGELPHTVAARDGSWKLDTLEPAEWFYATFDQPGTFLYHCTDHPWAIGEITVEAAE